MSSNEHKKPDCRKLLSAEARRILSLLEGRPLKDDDIMKEQNGRPYFPDRRSDFSISHSKGITAVSLVTGEKLRTGCDIELARPRVNIREITKSCFSASERDYIFPANENQSSEINFYKIWTLKECFLKLRGLSVFDMKSVPSFIGAEGRFAFDARVSSPLSFYVYELKGIFEEIYLLAVAIEGNEDLKPAIRWFSQSLLPVRSIVEIKAAPSPIETVSPKM
jgi:hypothetical protein